MGNNVFAGIGHGSAPGGHQGIALFAYPGICWRSNTHNLVYRLMSKLRGVINRLVRAGRHLLNAAIGKACTDGSAGFVA